jgi:helix-turn-helix protein
MSIRATDWALEQRIGDRTLKLILVALARYANDKGTCFPPQKTLAAIVECSLDTVQRGLKKLEDMGALTRERRHGKSGNRSTDLYTLSLSRTVVRPSPKPHMGAAKSKPHNGAVWTKPHMGAVANRTVSSESSVEVGLVDRESFLSNESTSGKAATPANQDSRQALIKRLAGVPLPTPLSDSQAEKVIAGLVEDFDEPTVKQAVGRLRSRIADGTEVKSPARILQLVCEDIERERRQRRANPHADHGVSRFGG